MARRSLAPAARLPRSWPRSATSRAPRRRCHLSQPAFSALIRALEEALGVRLFDRSTRHVAADAPKAPASRAGAARSCAEFDSAIADLHDHAARRRGRVSLALLPSLAAGWLPAVLARFRRAIRASRSTSPTCCRSLHRAGDDGAGRLRARRRARRARPSCSAEVFCSRRLPPGLPRRPSAGDRRARSTLRDLAAWPVHPPVAHQQRAPVPRRGVPSAGDGHGDGGRSAGDGDGHGRAGLGISVVPALTLFHFRPEIATRPRCLPGAAADLPRAPARPQPLGGGAGAARPGPRSPGQPQAWMTQRVCRARGDRAFGQYTGAVSYMRRAPFSKNEFTNH